MRTNSAVTVGIACVVASLFCPALGQVPRGFARPQGGGVQQSGGTEAPAGAVNAKLGMAGLHKLAQDPSAMAGVMEALKDPEAMAEARKMMSDPDFVREMEKIAGPMKQAMKQFAGAQGAQAGAQSAQLGLAALSRAMQDPNMLAEAMRAMQDPATMQQVKRMMSDPSFAAMMGKQASSAKDLLKGLNGDQNEATASRMRGLADWMNKQDEQQQLRDMLG